MIRILFELVNVHEMFIYVCMDIFIYVHLRSELFRDGTKSSDKKADEVGRLR